MDWGEVATELLVAAIGVFLPVALGMFVLWVRPVLKKLDEGIAQSIGRQQWDLTKLLAQQFVKAAEQQGVWDKLLVEGSAKKQWVYGRLDEALKARGINLDFEAINAAIEAAVHDMNYALGEELVSECEEG